MKVCKIRFDTKPTRSGNFVLWWYKFATCPTHLQIKNVYETPIDMHRFWGPFGNPALDRGREREGNREMRGPDSLK